VQLPELETKVRFAAVVSATETPVAVLGPLFVTVTVYVMLLPAVIVAGPVLVAEMSVDALTVVEAVDELFPGVGSVVVDETVAVLLMLPVKDGLIVYVLVIVELAPGANVPMEHGYAVVQPPLLETKVRFAGVVSATETPVAVLGPLLVTVTV
jgi:hypothetical protein